MLGTGPDLLATRPGQTLIGGKNYFGAGFEMTIAGAGIKLLRPRRQRRAGTGQVPGSSGPRARSSSRSTKPSRASSTWNSTAAALSAE
jgi:hypothetical protein